MFPMEEINAAYCSATLNKQLLLESDIQACRNNGLRLLSYTVTVTDCSQLAYLYHGVAFYL